MRCISCRSNMRVVRIEQDQAMEAAGYEHQTLECTACRKTERRLAFTGEKMAWPGYWHALLVLAPKSLIERDDPRLTVSARECWQSSEAPRS
jgi:hypothetical protein